MSKMSYSDMDGETQRESGRDLHGVSLVRGSCKWGTGMYIRSAGGWNSSQKTKFYKGGDE